MGLSVRKTIGSGGECGSWQMQARSPSLEGQPHLCFNQFLLHGKADPVSPDLLIFSREGGNQSYFKWNCLILKFDIQFKLKIKQHQARGQRHMPRAGSRLSVTSGVPIDAITQRGLPPEKTRPTRSSATGKPAVFPGG